LKRKTQIVEEKEDNDTICQSNLQKLLAVSFNNDESDGDDKSFKNEPLIYIQDTDFNGVDCEMNKVFIVRDTQDSIIYKNDSSLDTTIDTEINHLKSNKK
jgi:hypothetical protein